jgi:hypothetical protein
MLQGQVNLTVVLRTCLIYCFPIDKTFFYDKMNISSLLMSEVDWRDFLKFFGFDILA